MHTTQGNDLSEIRQDIVTGDWVIIATSRAKRPEEYRCATKQQDHPGHDVGTCPFESPETSGQENDTLVYRKSDGEWTLRVFGNKYPAVSPGETPLGNEVGPYFSMSGIGHHELVVLRDHWRHPALLDVMEIAELFDAYQERYLELMTGRNIRYISVIHNHGKSAGASLFHPHSQILAVPVVSPYVRQELSGSEQYYRATKSCVYCSFLEYDLKDRTRVIYENAGFVALCPFASRAAFEIWVLPKTHAPYFERMNGDSKVELAEVFKAALGSMYAALGNPDYNYYIHTAPCDGKDYPHFHWHIEILPKTATWAGFELSTGVEISTLAPETAARYLRQSVGE